MSGEFPEVRYADSGGVAIAYEVRGDGPVDLVYVPSAVASLMATTVYPVLHEALDRLASLVRLIRLDKRGVGMSDPLVEGGAPPLEQQVDDVLAVMDAVGSDRAALLSSGMAGQVGLMFAAMHPDRVSALVLNNAVARFFVAEDYRWGFPASSRERFVEHVRRHWGDLDQPWGGRTLMPSQTADPRFATTLARIEQVGATKSAAVAEQRVYIDSDVRGVLPLVQAPTLVTFAEESEFFRNAGQYLAEHIVDAQIRPLHGADLVVSPDNIDDVTATYAEFVTGVRPTAPTDRALAAVLFTDIAASTERVASLGDHAWRDLLNRYRTVVRDELRRFRGREINTRGDDFLATFDGPARAIRCAFAIRAAAARLEVDVRSGLHTGEVELIGDDVGGIAVHIGARVCALAGPGDVLVTSTVRDLVAGSGLRFSEHGQYTLKGVPGEWTILEVES
jgi:class 3 adenylate cyclase